MGTNIQKLGLAGIALVALLGAGCGKATIGMTCGSSDECATGLACLQQNEYDFAASKCAPGEKMCSVPCTVDSDCGTALGAGHICIGGASSTGITNCPPGMCFEGSRS